MGTEKVHGVVREEESDEAVDLFTVERERLLKIVSQSSFIKPLNYYFLIVLPEVEDKTRGGVILATESLENALVGNNIGRIVGKGGTIGGTSGVYADCRHLKVGDYVGYNPHGMGSPFSHRGWHLTSITDQAMRVHIPEAAFHTDGIFSTYKIRGIK
jgi:co-chaperonin GroES (HSP10)